MHLYSKFRFSFWFLLSRGLVRIYSAGVVLMTFVFNGIFILCYTHLKLALLFHKQDLAATGVGTTVVALER